MTIPASKDKTHQPAQQQDAEVEKLYDSCCGSCAPTSPTNSGITLDDLTSVTKGADAGKKSGNS
jgi:hypothetical protein